MNASGAYVDFAVLGSVVLVLLMLAHMRGAILDYRYYHDDRAAVSLLTGLLKVVIAIGLLISSLGLPLNSPTFALAGLSIARGALLVAGIVLLIADHQTDEQRRSAKK